MNATIDQVRLLLSSFLTRAVEPSKQGMVCASSL